MSGFIRYAAGELLFLPLRLLSAYADRSVVSPPSSVEAAGVDATEGDTPRKKWKPPHQKRITPEG